MHHLAYEQIATVSHVLDRIFDDRLRVLYLHGSAACGSLKSQSDLDFIAIVERPITAADRSELLTAMLDISAPYPRPAQGPRCIELFVFAESDLGAPAMPVAADFVYGEWLRKSFEAGEPAERICDPENTLLLATARCTAIAVHGLPADRMLPEIARTEIRQAMLALIPALSDTLDGDERNVLLTLARIWRTAATDDFVSKDAAADWALPRMPALEADTLAHARDAYRGSVAEDWAERRLAVRQTAAFLRGRAEMLLR